MFQDPGPLLLAGLGLAGVVVVVVVVVLVLLVVVLLALALLVCHSAATVGEGLCRSDKSS